MPNFKVTNLTTANAVAEDSVLPCLQNGVTKQISVLQIKNFFDDGTVTQISSGEAIRCDPNPITVTGTISFSSPGLMSLYAGSSDPSGWLICDGRSLAVSQYSDLFSSVGYTYGGSGANFNIPNLVGRSVFGLDNMELGAAGRVTVAGSSTLGQTAGSRQHTLSADQTPLVSHTHSFSGSFNFNADPKRTGNNSSHATGFPRSSFNSNSGGANTSLTLSINTSSSATGANAPEAHPNLPPFLLLNWIIKI
jgi:microcystin-dependent protein